MFVFEQDGELARRSRPLGLFSHLVGDAHGRQAHHVARLHAGVGVDPALVDAHLATADDAIDMGFGHAFELAYQKVVEALARRVFVDLHQARCGSGSGGGAVG